MDKEIDANPEKQRYWIEQHRQCNGDNHAEDLHLQHRKIGPEDQGEDQRDTDEHHCNDIDGVRPEKIAIFVGEEGIAVRATLFQVEHILENAIATAIGAMPANAPAQGDEQPFDGAVWEINW